jgi:hypothetical protein
MLWSGSGALALRKVELVRITWADSGPLAKALYCVRPGRPGLKPGRRRLAVSVREEGAPAEQRAALRRVPSGPGREIVARPRRGDLASSLGRPVPRRAACRKPHVCPGPAVLQTRETEMGITPPTDKTG